MQRMYIYETTSTRSCNILAESIFAASRAMRASTLGYFDPVAAATLGVVKRGIGVAQQFFRHDIA